MPLIYNLLAKLEYFLIKKLIKNEIFVCFGVSVRIFNDNFGYGC
jgi:hypothetical protein